MISVRARCTCGPNERFQCTTIQRRDPGPRDVLIDIAFAGICHSDIDHARSTRGKTMYPLVPGHEISGTVSAVGSAVTRFAVGDRVGIGNIVDSCGVCASCEAGLEQYCAGRSPTTRSGRDGERTYGATRRRSSPTSRFGCVSKVRFANAAPLFCAGITLYSALTLKVDRARGHRGLRWPGTHRASRSRKLSAPTPPLPG